MTTIDRAALKKGDRIRLIRTGTVFSDPMPNGLSRRVSISLDGTGGVITPSIHDSDVIELLERPLPEEPPEGSIVIFHHESGPEAWKRWGAHLGWLHAGNSTPTGRERRTGRQGLTWQELLEGPSRHVERTVITP